MLVSLRKENTIEITHNGRVGDSDLAVPPTSKVTQNSLLKVQNPKLGLASMGTITSLKGG